MSVFISADVEGVTGITLRGEITTGSHDDGDRGVPEACPAGHAITVVPRAIAE